MPRAKPVSRRAVLGALGLGLAGAAGGGTLIWREADSSATRHRTGMSAAGPASVADWVATRGEHYVIAHRGAGDVVPEHTMPAYQAALGWGAKAIEISTSSTSDGVLICMHDLTYDRTTNLTGAIHSMPSSVLTGARVLQPQLGSAWLQADNAPSIPRLSDVLVAVGGRAVLCVEAKRDGDYPAVIQMLEEHGLQRSVIVKLFHTSRRITQAKAAGYPVFCYLASNDVSAAAIAAAAAQLDRQTDYLVLPTTAGSSGTDSSLPADLLAAAVGTGIPVWLYPVHRRSEAAHYFAQGATGVVSSSIGYQLNAIPAATHDGWSGRRVAPGELSRDPAVRSYAPTWTAAGELQLGRTGAQQFVTLGQFAPVSDPTRFTISFEARWDSAPPATDATIVLALGQADDRYFEIGSTDSEGYTVSIDAAGEVEIHKYQESGPRTQLAAGRATSGTATDWQQFQVKVTPESLTVTGSSVTVSATDREFRGGYLHVGRGGPDDVVRFRDVRVQTG